MRWSNGNVGCAEAKTGRPRTAHDPPYLPPALRLLYEKIAVSFAFMALRGMGMHEYILVNNPPVPVAVARDEIIEYLDKALAEIRKELEEIKQRLPSQL